MKKVLTLTAILMIAMTISSVGVMTAPESNHVHDDNCIHDIVVVDGKISEQELDEFAMYLEGEPQPAMRNILCLLFGHDYVYQGAVITTDHRVYASQPRCVEEYYELYDCSRCGHNKYELLDSFRIYCCD